MKVCGWWYVFMHVLKKFLLPTFYILYNSVLLLYPPPPHTHTPPPPVIQGAVSLHSYKRWRVRAVWWGLCLCTCFRQWTHWYSLSHTTPNTIYMSIYYQDLLYTSYTYLILSVSLVSRPLQGRRGRLFCPRNSLGQVCTVNFGPICNFVMLMWWLVYFGVMNRVLSVEYIVLTMSLVSSCNATYMYILTCSNMGVSSLTLPSISPSLFISRKWGMVLWYFPQYWLLRPLSWKLRGESEGLGLLDDAQVWKPDMQFVSSIEHCVQCIAFTITSVLTQSLVPYSSLFSPSIHSLLLSSLLSSPTPSYPVIRSWILTGSDSLPSIAKSIRAPSTLRRERREDEPLYDSAAGTIVWSTCIHSPPSHPCPFIICMLCT